MNWISPTGFSPCAAMPTQSPLIRSSASGVSNTRSGPKRGCSPTVARKTPPLTPTSSPNTTTLGSSSIARASAMLTASISVISVISPPFEFAALRSIGLRQPGIEMIEHRLGRSRLRSQVTLDRCVDTTLAFGGKLFLFRFAPHVSASEKGPQPRDRLLLPARLDFRGRTVARCVVCGRMIAEPVGDRLDEAGAAAISSRFERLVGCRVHGHDVVAIDLLTDETRCDRLLRQRFGCGLKPQRYGNSPLIIDGDEHDRQLVHAREIHRFIDVALRGGAVTEQTYGNAGLLAQLEGVGDARSVRGLRSDGNAEREILDWPGEVIAALVAAPKQQDFLQLDPAPDQSGVVAIGGQQNVLVTHGAGRANRHRLLAKRCGIGSEPAGALQRHSFQVEGAHQHHRPVKPDEQPGIGGEGREPSMDRTVRREIAAVAHLEAGDHLELFVCTAAFGHVTDSRLVRTFVSCSREGASSHRWSKSLRPVRSWGEMGEQIRRQRKDNG